MAGGSVFIPWYATGFRGDALGDALTTAGVLLALATRLDRREPQTVRSLAALSRSHARG